MNYKASVIVPVYNAEKTLRRCVESIALGRERNVEIILVDDCSKDQSWKLCQELAEEFPNVHPVQNIKNSGVSHTRNHGLKEAQGEYILFVDSDDWVSEWYADTLIKLTEQYPRKFIISGFSYVNLLDHQTTEYLYNKSEDMSTVLPKSYFSLIGKCLIQSSCNKIFRREELLKYNIHFDEEQSMGEDFQLVLDYIQYTQAEECVVINRPLYYYVHANTTSLMSTFGLTQQNQEYKRLTQMWELSGAEAEEDYKRAQINLKQNYVYHIARNKKCSKAQKISYIGQIMGRERATACYRQQHFLMMKEKISAKLQITKHLPQRAIGMVKRKRSDQKLQTMRKDVQLTDISIISQNCVGGVFYHDMGAQFRSPTINLFIRQPDFVKMVLNLKYYMDQDLVMHWGEDCPVGRLDDVEIIFTHYMTCEQAKNDWNRRKERIRYDRILVLSTDRDGFDDEVYVQWEKISYPKILFTANSHYQDHAVYFPEFQSAGETDNLVDGKKFYKDGKLIETVRSFNR